VWAGLGMPVPGAGAASLGTLSFGTGEGAIGGLTSFGVAAGGGTVEGSVGAGLGIPSAGAGAASLGGLLFGTRPGALTANLASTTGFGGAEWSSGWKLGTGLGISLPCAGAGFWTGPGASVANLTSFGGAPEWSLGSPTCMGFPDPDPWPPVRRAPPTGPK